MENDFFNDELYLCGASTKNEFLNIFRMRCAYNENQVNEFLKIWESSHHYFKELSLKEKFIQDSIEVLEIDKKYEGKIKSISENILFSRTFSNLPISFKMVEISKIISCQRCVNLQYIDLLLRDIPKNPSYEELIEFCLSPKVDIKEPKFVQTSLDPPQFVFSSKNPDFRFLGMFKKEFSQEDLKYVLYGGSPIASLIIPIGLGHHAINLYSVGKKMILNNGFHRLYALYKLGIKYAPCVVMEIKDPELELPEVHFSLSKEYIINNERPSILKDFFNPNITMNIKTKKFTKTVKVTCMVDESIISAVW